MSAAPVQRVLVFRRGHIGDTLVALPAVWALRDAFQGARFSLLCDHPAPPAVGAAQVVEGSGLFDEIIAYPTRSLDASPGALALLRLAIALRGRGFDLVVYLAPSRREARQVQRDARFFSWCGIRRCVGATYPVPGAPVPVHESDRLLARLAVDGIAVPAAGSGRMRLEPGVAHREALAAVLVKQASDGGRPWVAIAPGSKMPAKVWSEERYAEVVATLLREHDLWPVVLGGPEDRPAGERLIAGWGRGYDLAGVLGIPGSLAALARCRLYLGNDTGTMHLAVSAGIPCVALFSARDEPGKWHPYGAGHEVLRLRVDCEGCLLTTCVEQRMRCLMGIGAAEALAACRRVLARPVAVA